VGDEVTPRGAAVEEREATHLVGAAHVRRADEKGVVRLVRVRDEAARLRL